MNNKDNQRDAKIFCIIGDRATGKTTFSLDMIEQLNRPRTLVLTQSQDSRFESMPLLKLSDINRFTGTCKFDLDELETDYNDDPTKAIKEAITQIRTNFHNGLLLIDDAAAIFPSYSHKLYFALIHNVRHLAIDVILNYHSFLHIPPPVRGELNYYIVLKSNDPPNRTQISNPYLYEALFEAWNEIYASEELYDFMIVKSS